MCGKRPMKDTAVLATSNGNQFNFHLDYLSVYKNQYVLYLKKRHKTICVKSVQLQI